MSDPGLRQLTDRLADRLAGDRWIQRELHRARAALACDRLLIYYFYSQWHGQVTFEALRDARYSIFGSSGPDECFNDDYAALYLQGRTRAIADIQTAAIHDCHRDFLAGLHVRANLVVPICVAGSLWGLLIAHDCRQPKCWSPEDAATLLAIAEQLAQRQSVR